MLNLKNAAQKEKFENLSANDLANLAQTAITDIEKRYEEILAQARLIEEKIKNLEEIKPDRELTLSGKRKLLNLKNEYERLNTMFQAMQERWNERIRLLAAVNRTSINNPLAPDIREIIYPKAGRYVINFFAVDYLKRLITDGRSLKDFTNKMNHIQELLACLDELSKETLIKFNNRCQGNYCRDWGEIIFLITSYEKNSQKIVDQSGRKIDFIR